MPDSADAFFQSLFRQAEQIKVRELDRRAYFGDGPTAQQIDELIRAVEPISGATEASASVLFATFRVAVTIENTWLSPEKDALAEPMIETLQLVQLFASTALDSVLPENKADLQKIASLAVVEKAARRYEALHRNKII